MGYKSFTEYQAVLSLDIQYSHCKNVLLFFVNNIKNLTHIFFFTCCNATIIIYISIVRIERADRAKFSSRYAFLSLYCLIAANFAVGATCGILMGYTFI